jgi:N-methylhydantoinase A
MAYRVGMDVGGTFTDFVVSDGARVILTWKEESTPEDSMRAVLLGCDSRTSSAGRPCSSMARRRR